MSHVRARDHGAHGRLVLRDLLWRQACTHRAEQREAGRGERHSGRGVSATRPSAAAVRWGTRARGAAREWAQQGSGVGSREEVERSRRVVGTSARVDHIGGARRAEPAAWEPAAGGGGGGVGALGGCAPPPPVGTGAEAAAASSAAALEWSLLASGSSAVCSLRGAASRERPTPHARAARAESCARCSAASPAAAVTASLCLAMVSAARSDSRSRSASAFSPVGPTGARSAPASPCLPGARPRCGSRPRRRA